MAILNRRLAKIVVGLILIITLVNLFLLNNNTDEKASVSHLNELISASTEKTDVTEENTYGISITLDDIAIDDIGAKGVPLTPAKGGSLTPPKGAPLTPAKNNTTSNAEEYSAEKHFETIIKNNKIILFSKTYCPFSKGMKEKLNKLHFTPWLEIIELDKIENGAALQAYVFTQTGRNTVPNLVIPASGLGSLGGYDDFKDFTDEQMQSKLDGYCKDSCFVTLPK